MKRSGFTLPEILVSITLVAVLAAVVVPTIASQVKKGDPARIGQDFVAVRGAVEQFLTDVRRYPASISQLQTVITASGTALSGTALGSYGTSDIARWRGPYLSKELTLTGYGVSVTSAFSNDVYAATGTSSCTPTTTCGTRYMVMLIPITAGNDSLMAVELDKQFDDGLTTSGVIRYKRCATASSPACSAPTTDADTLKLLLLPIY
jgi:prepilin-type N-terminal cleavage/methylation domain-containing protein